MRKNLLNTVLRDSSPLALSDWADYFNYLSTSYPYGVQQTLGPNKQQEIGGDYLGLVEGAYKANGVVFAAITERQKLFSEARFKFRQQRNGRPGDLFGTAELQRLEEPWVNGTTGDLLARALADVDLAGNAYFARLPGNRLRRLRPDWVTIVMGSRSLPEEPAGAVDLELVGYLYQPNGSVGSGKPVAFLAEDVAHWAPIPDPCANFRGISWLTSVIPEISADVAGVQHGLKFFENGATPNLVVSLDPAIDQDTFQNWIEAFDADHAGYSNAYKTMYLGGGADVKVVGSNLREVSFSETIAHGEARIAMAAGVPPIVMGLIKGLDAATYSNYGQARRAFADGTLRPLWRSVAGAFASIISVPSGAELWFDDRDISFLQEDQADLASIQQTQAITIKAYVDAGYTPESAAACVAANDLSLLDHTGMTSVQLLPPGTPKSNGSNGTAPQVPAATSS